MSTIITRAGKGSPLTNNEVDANFNNLNSTKLETSAVGTLSTQNANAVAITGGTINGTTVGATTVAAGSFSTLNSSGNTRLGGLSDNQSLQVNNVASAVNYAQVVGAVTGAAPTISAQGNNANIGLVLTGKGTGVVALGGSTVANSGFSVTTPTGTVDRVNIYGSAGGNPYFEATGTSATINLAFYAKGLSQVLFGRNGGAQNFLIGSAVSSVNFLQVVPAVTNGGVITVAAPELSAQGSDPNINLKLTPKGTGTLQFGTYTAGALSPTGFITITDAAGTSRRLLVG
jgi:hypothetical protein